MPTSPTTIPSLGAVPQTSDPLTFDLRADDLLAVKLPAVITATNAAGVVTYNNAVESATSAATALTRANAAQASATLSAAQVPLATAQAAAAAASAASALAAPATSATSTTSLTPGIGSKVFTTQAGKAFATGQTVVARSAAEPRQFMVGTVASYAGTTLTVTVTAFGQAPTAGAAADWNITFWGAVPAAAKPGQLLRLAGSTPEWGDEGGEPIIIRSTTNRHPESNNISGVGGALTYAVNDAIGPRGIKNASSAGNAGNTTAFAARILTGFTVGQKIVYERSLKAVSGSTTARIAIYVYGDGSDQWVTVDLSNGQIVDLYTNNASRVAPQAKVVSEGNGWYRVTMFITVHAAGNIAFYFFPDAFSFYQVADASVTDGAGQALYVEVPSTTPVAGAGVRKRNLVAYGKEIDTALGNWLLNGVTRIGKAASPAGDLSATIYECGTAVGTVYQAVTLEANTQYTASVWLRTVSGNTANSLAIFLTHSSDGTGTANETTFLAAEAVVGSWRRYSLTFTNVSATTGFVHTAYGLTCKFAVWGYQLEKGPRASNFINSGAGATDGQHADIELRRTHLVDTTYAAVDIAPPADMQPGDWFDVVDVGGNAATNNIKVLRGGVALIDGLAEDFVIDLNKWSGRFTYDQEKGLVIT